MKNIIFDLGSVILKDKPDFILDDIDIDNDEKENLRNKFFNSFKDVDLGNETLEELYNKGKFNLDNQTKYKIINYYRYRKLNTKLLNLINQLKERKMKVYILSDNNKETYEYLKSLKEFENIDGWIVSCTFHKTKKDGALYKELFEKYNLIPSKCLFIDDNINNIKKGTNLGMRCFHYKNNDDELINKIKKSLD